MQATPHTKSVAPRSWNILFQHCPKALLSILFTLLITPALHAIHDTNQNGVSDLWEKKFNSGALYPTFDPAADPDGDGWTNAQEASAGTNPGSGAGLLGLVRPQITHTPAVYAPPEEEGAEPELLTAEAITITWPTFPGKKYSLLSSTDLTGGSWTPYGRPSIGTGTAISTTVPVTPSDASNPTAPFWRVTVNDTDSDADTLTDSEEIEIGSSPNFADTNDDGEDDATAYAAGRNPATTDSDGDGAPDHELYSVEFEVTEQLHDMKEVGFGALVGTDDLHRYFTQKTSEEYSVSDSLDYTDIQNGKGTLVETYLPNGAFQVSKSTHYEGTSSYDSFLSHKRPPLSPDEQLEWVSAQTSVTHPPDSATETVTTTKTTRSWRVKKRVNQVVTETVLRSGTETKTHTDRKALTNGVTFQQLWTNHFKNIPWTASDTSTPRLFGPHDVIVEQLTPGSADVMVAGWVRSYFKNNDFSISAKISRPTCHNIGNYNRSIWDVGIKSLRWRWVRFNPLKPFQYDYVAPPATYQKQFNLLVQQQQDKFSLLPEFTTTTDETKAKGIIQIDCKGRDGIGWHTVAAEKYTIYNVEKPAGYDDLDFAKNGSSRVDFNTLPIQTVSRDKFLAGSFDVPSNWTKLEMEIIGPDGSLGKSSDLLGTGTTKVYDKVEDVLKGSDYVNGCQPATQKVWFVRDAPGSRRINFYTCLNRVGAVKIILYMNGDPQPLEINHTLTAAPDFAGVIRYVNDWVKGTSFDFGGGTPPLGLRFSSRSITAPEEINYLTSACLITFFNTVQHVEGLTSVVIGLFDGIKTGLSDDKKFIEFVVSNVAFAGTYSYLEAKAEIELWRTDPLKRATEMTNITRQFVQDVVFKKLEATRKKLSTWNGFRDVAWNNLKRVGSVVGTALTLQYTVALSLWPTIVDGFCEWHTDFDSRMLLGGEKAAFLDTAWVKTKLIASGADLTVFDSNGATIRTYGYTYGYSSGYIVEQVAVGALTSEAGNLAKVAIKGGISLASNLSLRTAFAVSSRSHLLKRWLAGAAVSIEMEVAAALGLTDATRLPISPLYKDIPAEAIEQAMRRTAYDRSLFNLRLVGEEVAKAPRLQTLFVIQQSEAHFWDATGKFVKSLGEETSAGAMKGWVKAYDRCLKIEGGALLDDRAADLFKLVKIETVEGKKALKKSLEEFGATDGSGKFWLRDVDKIQAKGYRYVNQFELNKIAENNGRLPLNSGRDEQYFTLDANYTNGTLAKNALQLPRPASEYVGRIEFDLAPVKDKIRLARGKNESAEWFEPVARDYPDLGGSGGGTQLLIDGSQPLILFKPFGQF